MKVDANGKPILEENDGTGAEGNSESQEPTPPSPWQPLLDVLPTDLHATVMPVLQEQDRNVQKGFEKYQPFKELIDQYDAETLTKGVALLQNLDQDPERVWTAIGEAYGLTKKQAEAFAQQQTQTPTEPTKNIVNGVDLDDLDLDDPVQKALSVTLRQLQELQQTTGQITQNEQARLQQQEEQQARQQLEETLSALETKHGTFDRKYVLGLMAAGEMPEQAVESYKSLVATLGANTTTAPPAPPVMGSGGSVPSTQTVNPGSMKSAEIESLVEQMLANAAKE